VGGRAPRTAAPRSACSSRRSTRAPPSARRGGERERDLGCSARRSRRSRLHLARRLSARSSSTSWQVRPLCSGSPASRSTTARAHLADAPHLVLVQPHSTRPTAAASTTVSRLWSSYLACCDCADPRNSPAAGQILLVFVGLPGEPHLACARTAALRPEARQACAVRGHGRTLTALPPPQLVARRALPSLTQPPACTAVRRAHPSPLCSQACLAQRRAVSAMAGCEDRGCVSPFLVPPGAAAPDPYLARRSCSHPMLRSWS